MILIRFADKARSSQDEDSSNSPLKLHKMYLQRFIESVRLENIYTAKYSCIIPYLNYLIKTSHVSDHPTLQLTRALFL